MSDLRYGISLCRLHSRTVSPSLARCGRNSEADDADQENGPPPEANLQLPQGNECCGHLEEIDTRNPLQTRKIRSKIDSENWIVDGTFVAGCWAWLR